MLVAALDLRIIVVVIVVVSTVVRIARFPGFVVYPHWRSPFVTAPHWMRPNFSSMKLRLNRSRSISAMASSIFQHVVGDAGDWAIGPIFNRQILKHGTGFLKRVAHLNGSRRN